MLPVATRQIAQEYAQTARIITSALIAITVGFVSLSYGITSLGLDTLAEVAREVAARQRAERAGANVDEITAADPVSA